MKTIHKSLSTLLLFMLISVPALLAQPLAFPGADGFGKYTTGGRGGRVIYVTNLNDRGAGSLRAAVAEKGARTILFSVSGTIALESTLSIKEGNLTIAGQSAPGEGICIRNHPVWVAADNVIIRYLRFRLGDEHKVEGDAIGASKGNKNMIIDHCSMSWATDECASFYRNKAFTMQWCIISESLNASVHQKGEHGYGGIWGGEGASFHHNLLSSHKSRMPRFSGSSTTLNSPDELVDFRNNVIYNWEGNNTYGGERGRYNVCDNYYKAGPATQKSRKQQLIDCWSPLGQFYIQGNVLEGEPAITKDNSLGIRAASKDSALIKKAFPVTAIAFSDANKAYKEVLAQAGASFHRDAVDQRVVEEARAGNSKMGKQGNGIIDSQQDVGSWPPLRSLPAPQDTDGDGMPDEWERKHKLNPNNAADGISYVLSKSYTNLEIYLNELITKR